MIEQSPLRIVSDAAAVPARVDHTGTLARLEGVTESRGLDDLTSRLAVLRNFVADDLAEVEAALGAVDASLDTPMHRAAMHLVDAGGKRLRPMCVALAARAGAGFDRNARDLAVAAELVHNATLLHDDVVDLGDLRRGVPTARVVYGNAASVYAGDWLLVEALRRIRVTGYVDLLDRALGVLQEMLDAEGLQLAFRGRGDATVDDWRRVVDGKTASLFRWALYAGGRAGGLDADRCDALERYGHALGVAFQLVDDVLDVSGDPGETGKALFTDLREGKLTYPLLLAMARDGGFAKLVAEAMRDEGGEVSAGTAQAVMAALHQTRSLEDSMAFARRLSEEAVASLATLPAGRAREALNSVAVAMLHRKK